MLKNLLLAGWSLLAVPLLHQPVCAQALDPTFTPPASLYAPGTVYSLGAQQTDGKRVVAGYFTRVNHVAVGCLVRLDAAGVLDQPFAQHVGVARNAYRVKALPNGQYLVSSFANSAVTAGGLTRNSLLRLNADGTADTRFDAGTGPALTTSGNYQGQINTFVGQSDGKLLIGGYFTLFNGQPAGHLVRLNADGSLDSSFKLGAGFDAPVYALLVQPDGKLLVGGGFGSLNGELVNAVVRLNADGSRDASFTSAIHRATYVGALALQPDGKVLATGVVGFNTVDASLVRLNADGSADPGFTAPGYTFNFSGSYFDPNVLVQPNGKVLFFGNFAAGGDNYLLRLNADGTRDATFNLSVGSFDNYPFTLGLQADGSLLVGSSFDNFNGRETPLGRLTSTGAADPAYAPQLQAPGSVAAVLRQADGSLLVGGDFTEYSGTAVHRLAHLSAAGSLDAAYAAATGLLPGRVLALAQQPAGQLLAGTSRGLRRFLPTGRPDATFSDFATNSYVEALAVQPDGRILAAGGFPVPTGSNQNGSLVRLTAAGESDRSFAPGSTSSLGTPSQVRALQLQPDGKLLVAGNFPLGTSYYVPHVVRYESTGAVDASFSTSPVFAPATGPVDYATQLQALALQPDGQVVVGGSFTLVNGVAHQNLARLTATGQLDASFVSPPTLTGVVTTLVRQPNGRLLVGSMSSFDGTAAARPLTRVLESGSADASFQLAFSPGSSVNALLVQPDGRLVVGGSFATIGGQAAAGLARLTAPNVLAVPAPAAQTAFSAWPVPAQGLLHVAVAAEAQQAELLDALGQVVRRQELRGVSEFSIATYGLPAGVYVLQIRYASGTVARRLTVE